MNRIARIFALPLLTLVAVATTAEAECRGSVAPAMVAGAAPSAADLTFRITNGGVFRASVTLDETPENACVVRLRSRLAVEQVAFGSTRVITTKSTRKRRVNFIARNMPDVRRQRGKFPELNLEATVTCPGAAPVKSNVFARFLDCGFGPASTAVSATAWVNLLRKRIS